jgi:hypothetical protein
VRAINNSLAASTDFLEQFVIAEVLQDVRRRAGVTDSGYRFVPQQTETCLQNAGGT